MTRRGFLALAAAARDESIARVAERELASQEFMLLASAGTEVVASRWPNASVRAPLGSLVKPFVALAYGESHGFRYPEFVCNGCWLPRGHGRVDISTALAESCNSYFTQLAALTGAEEMERTVSRFGLPMPPLTSAEIFIGRHGTWRATPLETVLAFNELSARRTETGVALILAAMRRCAHRGTAAGVAVPAAAKTGTAPCVHANRAAGDGLLVAMFPPEAPDFVLLVRAHGVPGAECARRTAGFLKAVR